MVKEKGEQAVMDVIAESSATSESKSVSNVGVQLCAKFCVKSTSSFDPLESLLSQSPKIDVKLTERVTT